MTEDRQRIDKWLWYARVVRTRTAAAELVTSGHVRLNGQRIDAASRPVRPGDVVTVALDARVRVLKVTGFALRRGDATSVAALYLDLAPPAAELAADQPSAAVPSRDPGAGRPTKQERRALDEWRRRGDGD